MLGRFRPGLACLSLEIHCAPCILHSKLDSDLMKNLLWLRSIIVGLTVCCVNLSCSEHYPIAPTRCDDWCTLDGSRGCSIAGYPPATHGKRWSDPAHCVAYCEDIVAPAVPECSPRFDTYLECAKRSWASNVCDGPPADAGFNGPVQNCTRELQELDDCKACAGLDCTLCNSYCSLKRQPCYDPSCVYICAQTMLTRSAKCNPQFAAYIECQKQLVTPNVCSDPFAQIAPCNLEWQNFMYCRNGY